MSNEKATRVRIRRRKLSRQLARWLAVPALAIAGSAVGSASVDASRDDATVDTRHVFDLLRLQCEGSDGTVAQIACRWTVPHNAASVKLIRVVVGSDAGRQTVFRTSDPSINRYVDSPVRRGVRYLYVVRAVDSSGALVAASRTVVAGVAESSDSGVEALRLDCSATGEVTARCRWTAPTSLARVLTLWRSVDGAARERVESFANPFPTSYGDVVPASTSRAVYAVIATDGAGEIVARSRAEGVTFPPAEVDARPVDASPVDVLVDATDPDPAGPPTPSTDRPATDRPATDRPQPPRTDVVNSTVPTRDAPVDEVSPTEPVRPADDERRTDESDGESRSSTSDESGRDAPSGERDRAG